MLKLNLIEILKNTIVEQAPIGQYSTGVNKYYTLDPSGNVKEIDPPKKIDSQPEEDLTDDEVEELEYSKSELMILDTYPTIGKCMGWSREIRDGVKNGDLPSNMLKKLKNHSTLLDVGAASMFDEMEKLHKKAKGTNFNAGGGSGYRTYERQWEIFDLDYCVKTGLSRKVNTDGKIPVAKPGTSNHGWGEAIDLDSNAKEWISSNGSAFGWCWGESPGEPWHFTYDLVYCRKK